MTDMNFEHLPNYLDLADAAEELGANTGLAEAHGVLVGLACGTAELKFDRWYEEIFKVAEEGDHLAQRYVGEMQALFDTTLAMLADEGVSFMPMLPETDSQLSAIRRERSAKTPKSCWEILLRLLVRVTTTKTAMKTKLRWLSQSLKSMSAWAFC